MVIKSHGLELRGYKESKIAALIHMSDIVNKGLPNGVLSKHLRFD